jgi:hypothetical protein
VCAALGVDADALADVVRRRDGTNGHDERRDERAQTSDAHGDATSHLRFTALTDRPRRRTTPHGARSGHDAGTASRSRREAGQQALQLN